VIRRAREAVDGHHTIVHRELRGPEDSIDGRSHVLMPTRVIGGDLVRILDDLVGPPGAAMTMYRLGEWIGARAAETVLDGTDEDVAYRLLIGALHHDRAGYGNIDLLIWEPRIDPRFAVLWESESSCCATVALSEGRRGRSCHVLAGYWVGWSARATGLRLEAAELSCRAEGVARCRFLLAHADRLEDHLRDARFYRPTAEYAEISLAYR
jgi:predicted hydrocarbon binding protein